MHSSLLESGTPPCSSFVPIKAIVIIAILIIGIGGCGGGQESSVSRNLLAERAVVVENVPNLKICLARINAALKNDVGQFDGGLSCAEGTYRGLTGDGYKCSLTIDAMKRSFHFEVGRDIVVEIQWGDIAHSADGRPIHNLEDASVSFNPGIQLTRFTGGLSPQTEALILRASSGGTGPTALPKMIYQLSGDRAIKFTECNFGK